MTALAAERDTRQMLPGRLAFPIADNVKIYKGSLVMLDGGYAKPGATATGKVAVGRAVKTYDNTVVGHALAALTVEVEPGIFKWVNGESIAQASVGATAYITDDQTVGTTSTGKSAAGTIIAVDSDGVWVATGITGVESGEE